ncbi:MAG: DNA polymerase III subunit delta' [Bacillota bacterium]
MRLKDIRGQNLAIRQLLNALSSGQVAHAYLFTGPAGVGKRTTAMAVSQALNCLHPDEDGEPCGECPPCKKIALGNHPDVRVLGPEGASIKINQVRIMQAALGYRHFEGRYKVVTIQDAEKMTLEAANCILKILEEPPPNTVFMLVTDRDEGILPTIVSRCQAVRFNRLPVPLLAELTGQQKETGSEKDYLMYIAGGSLSKARELLADEGRLNRRMEAVRLLESIPESSRLTLLDAAANLEGRDDLDELFEEMLFWYRDLLVLRSTEQETLVINRDLLQAYRQQSVSSLQAEEAAAEIHRVRKLIGQNVNKRLALEVLMFKLSSITRQPGGQSN